MALNLKNSEVERLAGEVASLAGESKTEAIRRALEDRRDRLSYRLGGLDRGQRLRDLLEHEIWPMIPRALLGPLAPPDAARGGPGRSHGGRAGAGGGTAYETGGDTRQRGTTPREPDADTRPRGSTAHDRGGDTRQRGAGRGAAPTGPMIIDASALLEVFFRGPGHDSLLHRLAGAKSLGIGAPTLADMGTVLCARTKRDSRALLSRFLQECEAQTVSFGESHWRVALDAFLRYGEGRHAADLSLPDCLTYAVAKLAAQPLLTATPGFSRTDLVLA